MITLSFIYFLFLSLSFCFVSPPYLYKPGLSTFSIPLKIFMITIWYSLRSWCSPLPLPFLSQAEEKENQISDLNSLPNSLTRELKIRVVGFLLKKLYTHFEICYALCRKLLLCKLPLLTIWHTVLASRLDNHVSVKQMMSIRSIEE